MQVGTLAVQHVFEKDVLYEVPLYQRPYVWNEEEQWQPLWEDVRRIAELVLDGHSPRAHFLGASVQDRVTVPPGHIESRLLIDGQQRLTTLQILLKSFGDVVRAGGDQRYAAAIDKLVRNDHPLSTEPHERFKVWPTNADRADFTNVMEAEGRAALARQYGARADARAVGRTIVDSYLFFHRMVAEWLGDTGGDEFELRVGALYGTLRDSVRLVVIDLDEKDDAQLIFETLNARGTPLLSADLVKNALLNEVEREKGNTELAYQKYWQTFDYDSGFWRALTGRGHAQRARIEIFLQHALTILSSEEVTAAHLYAAYRDLAKAEGPGRALERMAAFKKYGEIYKRLLTGYDQPRVKLFLERLATMGFETSYPFLIKLFDLLEDDERQVLAVLVDLESFLVRRMVCRLSTRGYSRFFVDLLRTLDSGSSDLHERVRRHLLSGTAEVDRWPDDGEFRESWIANPLYENLTRPRLRLLLEALECGLRNDFAETMEVPRNLTVEHIMPQSWETHWPLSADAPAQEAASRRNRLIHTIGNLTLLNGKLNPIQSNKPWLSGDEGAGGKREALREHSVLFLNKAAAKSEAWNEDTVEERSSILFEVARAIWPHPSS